MKKTIFISYANCESSNELRNTIVPLINSHYNVEEYAGKIKKNEDYNISDLIKSIGMSEIIIIILSEKYLTKSRFCIEEVREIILRDRDDLKKRVFPIMDSTFQDMLGDEGLGNEQILHQLKLESKKFIEKYIEKHLSLADEPRKRQFSNCIDTQSIFLKNIFDKSNWVFKSTDYEQLIEKIQTVKIKKAIIKKSFNENDCDKVLAFKYPQRELLEKCKGTGTYRYRVWKCDDFHGIYTIAFFQATTAPIKAIEHFLDNLKQCSKKPTSVTILRLRDVTISKTVQKLLNEKNINNRIMTYNEYFWKECVKDKFFSVDTNEINEYYIEQKFYSYSSDPKSLDIAIKTINQFLLNENTKPITLILADAGIGKTQLIKQVMNHIDHELKDRNYIFIDSRRLRKSYINLLDTCIINSIYDLYNIYFRAIGDSQPLNFNEFEIGLANGTVVILIDGWDEIKTLFSQKLNENDFFNSLFELNLKLGECKIIITSRYIGWNKNKLLNDNLINVYTLQGFDEELLNKYLRNRYKKYIDISNEEKNRRIEKVKIYINKIRGILHDNERSVPFITDLLCKIIDDEREYADSQEINLSTPIPYPNNNYALDRVLYADLEREYSVQSYKNIRGINVTDIVKILIIFAVEFGDSGDEVDMKLSVSQAKVSINDKEMDSLVKEKLKLLRYFDNSSENFKFTYELFKNNLISLFFINLFTNNQNSLIKIEQQNIIRIKEVLGKLQDAENDPIFRDIVKYFEKSKEKQLLFNKNAKLLLKEIINILKKEISEIKIDDIPMENRTNKKIWSSQYSISALLYLLIHINGKHLNIDEKTQLIKDLYDADDTIEYLSINNDFFPLDFSSLKIKNTIFDNFNNFEKCKFKQTVFENTEFQNMKNVYYPKNKDVLNIDSTCILNCMGDIENIDNEKYGEILQAILQKFLNKNRKFQEFSIAKTSNPYFLSQLECLFSNNIVSKEDRVNDYVFRISENIILRRNLKDFIYTPIISSSLAIQSTVECLKALDSVKCKLK